MTEALNYIILTLNGSHDSSAGKVTAVSINAAGTGYSVNDVLTVSGGGGDCTLNVDTVGTGGDVTGVSITTAGTRYSTATGSSTTVAPTGGSGCTIDIDTVATTLVCNEAVPSSGYPFMLVVATPFEIIQADSQESTYVMGVTRRQESTTNTTQLADDAQLVCELTHVTLEDVYDSVLLSQKLIGDNETGSSRTGRTPDINEVTVDTTANKVYIGVDGTPNTWEEFAPESHADLADLTTSTDHTQYYTDTRGNTWHGALSAEHVGVDGVLTASINAAGSGYSVNDVLTISGGNGDATLTVTTVGTSGDVTAFTVTTVGSGYSTSTGSSTTVNPTGGSGCTIDIDSVTDIDHNHLIYPAANIRNLASEPADTTTGGVYYNTTNYTLYYYDGADWKQYNTVPPDAIIFREDGSCPSGWTEKTGWDGYYLKGDDSATWAGGTGGSATHTHTLSEVPAHSHTIPDRTITVDSVSDHTHEITGGTGSTGSQRGRGANYSANFTLATNDSSHSHTITVPQHTTNSSGTSSAESQSTTSHPKYVELTVCEKN